MEKIKSFIKKNDGFYVGIKGLMSLGDPSLNRLIRGYYDNDSEYYSLIVNGVKFLSQGKKPIYIADQGWKAICTKGFGALLSSTLSQLALSDILGFEPIIIWGTHTHYYDPKMNNYSVNVFNYYFQGTPDVRWTNIDLPYILASENNYVRIRRLSDYIVNDSDIEFYAALYKKYIRLNDKTKKYLQDQISHILRCGKTLGVHIRGTDYAKGFKGHPKKIPVEEFTYSIRQIMRCGKYDQIFLATDDLDVLRVFQKEFRNEFVYYDDTFRTSGEKGPHTTLDNRPFHQYKLGLEVLRDIYTLVSCDGFICGMSNVSLAVRYISRSLEKPFDDFILLNNGINRSGVEMPGTIRIKG